MLKRSTHLFRSSSDELSLIGIYNAGSRKVTITALIEMQQYLEDDEDELRELTDNAVKKLSKLMMSSMKDQTCSWTSKTETPVN